MAAFGVSAEEEEMYRYFLRYPNSSTEGLQHRLRTDPEAAETILERLCQLGLVGRGGEERGISPTDPEIAMPRLIDRRMRELQEELLRVTQAHQVLDALRAEARVHDSGQRGVEQLPDPAQIRSRMDDLAFFAREEILCVEPRAELDAESINHLRPLHQRCLRRGVRLRHVVPAEALRHSPVSRYLREIAATGAEIRTADVSEHLLVYDRRAALIRLDPEDGTRGALLAHEEGLVSHSVALFEKIWADSAELPGVADEPLSEDAPTLSEMERRVLRSLVSVGKDEAGARQLGISVRTYRRHVADLMRALGAASRAQAALLARDFGWL
ncbi:LuxR family transcriptional regulator [Streptomyces oceani]|uniref:LuxR family transcriptional regulator n=3 Tax=Streptomyces oceani TaxID=1075402 RepID=A0A1E7KKC9_9ACTN|nr:LuxR family transcriptional regulator [Streptomyces oceani]